MKRIYKKRKSRALREKALEQLRQTRAAIEKEHPELLDEMREKIEAAQGAGRKAKPVERKAPIMPPPPKKHSNSEMVDIDRTKNLQTILKYLALNPGNQDLKNSLKDFL